MENQWSCNNKPLIAEMAILQEASDLFDIAQELGIEVNILKNLFEFSMLY